MLISCSRDNGSLSVQMIVELDTTYTTIGNPVSYSVKVQSPKDKIIQFPDWILEDPLEVRSSDFAFPVLIKSETINLFFGILEESPYPDWKYKC